MKVNGVIIDLVEEISLYNYLEVNNYDVTKIAVEHNGDIIPKNNYKKIILINNDSLEIVSFVGGG